jgi:hypothetical protein
MYEKLGLKNEDAMTQNARDEAESSEPSLLWVPANLDCGDVLPTEISELCD